MKTYDSLQIILKKNDKKFTIYSITGIVYFKQNFENCLYKQKEIFKELSNLFKDAKIDKAKKVKHPSDKLGTTWIHAIYFDFKSSDQVELTCIDASIESKIDDYLLIAIDSKELLIWLSNYYHK
jgi:hypothetical protein